MFFSWLGSRGNMRSNIRFTRGDLRRRKWLFMCLVRMIWPEPVILKRRAAPLWVFILGMEMLAPAKYLVYGITTFAKPAFAGHRPELYHKHRAFATCHRWAARSCDRCGPKGPCLPTGRLYRREPGSR